MPHQRLRKDVEGGSKEVRAIQVQTYHHRWIVGGVVVQCDVVELPIEDAELLGYTTDPEWSVLPVPDRPGFVSCAHLLD